MYSAYNKNFSHAKKGEFVKVDVDEFQFSIVKMVLQRKGMTKGNVRLMENELQMKNDSKFGTCRPAL